MMFAAGILVALMGWWLGGLLGSGRAVNVAAAVALAASGLGTFFWQMPPYRYLFDTLRYTYVVLMFGMFFLSVGILIRGLLARAWRVTRTPSR